MNGKLMVAGIVGVALAMGAGLWYSQTYAYYERVDGLEEVTAYGDAFPVSDYRGITADTSPLKLRACFTVDWDYVPTDTYKDVATPLQAPGWFDCFDAQSLTEDIASGAAVVLQAERNQPFGFSRFIAQYPDGRAFMWRQMNECGLAQFEGEDLPESCTEEEAAATAPVGESRSLAAAQPDAPASEAVVEPVDLVIALTPVGGGAPEDILHEAVTALGGGAQSLWACFRTPMSTALLTETYEVLDAIAPEQPDAALPCFDAEAVTSDVNRGDAVAFLGEKDVVPGVDRVVAVYEDGRALAWNQKRTN
ncbi:DUF6446 family protein [Neptunicoccus cionae]|uniref:DUF6446 family protein n=1 Tax=Neptunicoccus cionae TaxID=2035344 RepID=UPI000C769430|nr:DUF6446 family protein [Amylibacter cionae]PLS22223.1 hypothetical protein C0U40_07295 [Amylibacter cionae]